MHVHGYTKITEVNLFVFVYRLFHEDFSPILSNFYHVWFQNKSELHVHGYLSQGV